LIHVVQQHLRLAHEDDAPLRELRGAEHGHGFRRLGDPPRARGGAALGRVDVLLPRLGDARARRQLRERAAEVDDAVHQERAQVEAEASVFDLEAVLHAAAATEAAPERFQGVAQLLRRLAHADHAQHVDVQRGAAAARRAVVRHALAAGRGAQTQRGAQQAASSENARAQV